MKFACRYAILRFLPLVETGEFANVGVVLLSTTGRYFGFRLLRRRIARVTHFFDLHDAGANALRNGLGLMRDELTRVENQLKTLGTDRRLKQADEGALEAQFSELVRARESIFRFDVLRALVCDAPETALNDLFARYVERDFATKQHQEAVLERGLRRLLHEHNLDDRFQEAQVGDEHYHFKFPFVANSDSKLRIIKPLHLTHTEPAKAIDHGVHWAGRVAQLRRRNLLDGEILFALEGGTLTLQHEQATLDVEQMLREVGVHVVPHTARKEIIDFAKAA